MPDIHPSTDYSFWLSEYQKTMTNVRWWINHGKTETATLAIDELIKRWQLGCQVK